MTLSRANTARVWMTLSRANTARVWMTLSRANTARVWMMECFAAPGDSVRYEAAQLVTGEISPVCQTASILCQAKPRLPQATVCLRRNSQCQVSTIQVYYDECED